jgi:hypothetical protein
VKVTKKNPVSRLDQDPAFHPFSDDNKGFSIDVIPLFMNVSTLAIYFADTELIPVGGRQKNFRPRGIGNGG